MCSGVVVAERVVALDRKAIQSLRLRLHSGLRQSGGVCDAAIIGTPEGVPFLFPPDFRSRLRDFPFSAIWWDGILRIAVWWFWLW
jgi:hypothetical protein